MSARLGVQPTEVSAQFSGLILPDLQQNQQFLSGQHATLKNTVSVLANLMWKQKLLEKTVQTDKLINGNLLPTHIMQTVK
jgi:hypothetical protein